MRPLSRRNVICMILLCNIMMRHLPVHMIPGGRAEPESQRLRAMRALAVVVPACL